MSKKAELLRTINNEISSVTIDVNTCKYTKDNLPDLSDSVLETYNLKYKVAKSDLEKMIIYLTTLCSELEKAKLGIDNFLAKKPLQ